jgi:hypothetical protein
VFPKLFNLYGLASSGLPLSVKAMVPVAHAIPIPQTFPPAFFTSARSKYKSKLPVPYTTDVVYVGFPLISTPLTTPGIYTELFSAATVTATPGESLAPKVVSPW